MNFINVKKIMFKDNELCSMYSYLPRLELSQYNTCLTKVTKVQGQLNIKKERYEKTVHPYIVRLSFKKRNF